jgi:hypothetical protein
MDEFSAFAISEDDINQKIGKARSHFTAQPALFENSFCFN